MPIKTPLIIATRGSDLALWQTELVRARLARLGVEARLEIMKTRGDQDRTTALVDLGSTGSFTHELERRLVEGDADLAVHSLKDLPTRLLTGLTLAAILERADVADILLIHPAAHVPDRPLGLAPEARVGTGSTRRAAQLLACRPDLRIEPIRGNVPTRVEKIRGRRFDATVLAAAGLERLGLDTEPLVRVRLDPPEFLPAPGQGAIAIECRRDAGELIELLGRLQHPATADSVRAERTLLARFNGGCSLPLGCLAHGVGEEIRLDAVLGPPAGESPPGDPVSPEGLVRVSCRGRDPRDVARRAHGELTRCSTVPGTPERRLLGQVVALCRPADASSALAEELRAAGAVVIEQAVSRRAPFEDRPAEQEVEAGLERVSWCVFTSAAAVESGLAWLRQDRPRARFGEALASHRVSIAAVGPATAAALLEAGLEVTLEQTTGGGEALARALVEEISAMGERATILWPCARAAADALPRILEESGHRVLRLPLYETSPLAPGEVAGLPEGAVDVIVLTSPSGAQGAVELELLSAAVPVIAIGPTTAAAAERLGVAIRATAKRPCAEAIIEVIP